MAQITMYPAFVNSVETTITNSISDTDTIIYVLADTAIPSAPNLLVLGTGASAETVLMTDKTGNMLTVIRGVQGSAKPWPNSTIIARNYTAYDHDTFKANIEDNTTQLAQKADKGTPTETVISTGFASGWSGTIKVRKNQMGLITYVLNLTKSSDISTSTEFIYTLPTELRPITNMQMPSVAQGTTLGRVRGGLLEIYVDSGGEIGITSTGSVTAGVDWVVRGFAIAI